MCSLCSSVCRCGDLLFFFFKQKTAYEMRISDWSSDVCSSDLALSSRWRSFRRRLTRTDHVLSRKWRRSSPTMVGTAKVAKRTLKLGSNRSTARTSAIMATWLRRSEEHTSELQSLMRISYAVFCLKKKNQQRQQPTHNNNASNTRIQ